VSDSEPKFVIFGDVLGGYWWRLRSAKEETVESSGRRHPHKAECEREVRLLKEEHYPSAKVRDATIG
jgi:uncharacterized protein YegP (UPF0339 family)